MLDQFCLNIMENMNNIPVTADRPAENPVRDAAIEFDILVRMIWFLLRVLTDDGDLETEKGIG